MIGIDESGLYNIKIDFGKMETYVSNNNLIYTENDFHTAKFIAKLVKNGEVIDLTNLAIRIKIMLSSGATMEHVVTVKDDKEGIIEFTFPDNALYEGVNEFQIVLNENDKIKISPRLSYKVLDVIDDSNIVAESNYPILVQLISDVRKIQENEVRIQAEEDKRVIAENTRVTEFNGIKKEFKTLKEQNDTNIRELKDARVDYENETHINLKHRLDKYEKELVNARTSVDGKVYDSLTDKLNNIEHQFEDEIETLEG